MTPIETLVSRLVGLLLTLVAMVIVYWVKRGVRQKYHTIPSDTPITLHTFGVTTMFSALVVLVERPLPEVIITLAAIVILALLLTVTTGYWRDLLDYDTPRQYRTYRRRWLYSLLVGFTCCCSGIIFMVTAIYSDYAGFSIYQFFGL